MIPSDTKSNEPIKPTLFYLPNLKVSHCHDPKTGNKITTREDLVVVVTNEENNSTLVQHADGTHIYSEELEFFPPSNEEDIISCKPTNDVRPFCCKYDEFGRDYNGLYKPRVNLNDDIQNNPNNFATKSNKKCEETSTSNGKKIVGKTIVKDSSEEEYVTKQPIQGLLGEPPSKLGIQFSKFAEAQKTHSQTWPPKGYGETSKEVPNWMWPLQPCGHPVNKLNAPPFEDKSPHLQPVPKDSKHSVVWHVHKDGLAKVHGKVNNFNFFNFFLLLNFFLHW